MIFSQSSLSHILPLSLLSLSLPLSMYASFSLAMYLYLFCTSISLPKPAAFSWIRRTTRPLMRLRLTSLKKIAHNNNNPSLILLLSSKKRLVTLKISYKKYYFEKMNYFDLFSKIIASCKKINRLQRGYFESFWWS